MKNKLISIVTILLVSVMALSVVACDTNTVDEKESKKNGTVTSFAVDVAEQTNNKWKMTYKECQIKNKLDSFTADVYASGFSRRY